MTELEKAIAYIFLVQGLAVGYVFLAMLERRRRVDQTLFAAVMEAYVHGVSTRKVDDFVKALSVDSGISKFEASQAIGTVFQGAGWQRRRVHFMRNVLAVVPKGSQEMVASIIRTIFVQPDLLAFATFPRRHWRQIWLTNPLERVNKEIKRRTDIVGVFPNTAALLRLAGSVLIEQHEEWEAAERRYFSEASMLELAVMNDPVDIIDEAVIRPELSAA